MASMTLAEKVKRERGELQPNLKTIKQITGIDWHDWQPRAWKELREQLVAKRAAGELIVPITDELMQEWMSEHGVTFEAWGFRWTVKKPVRKYRVWLKELPERRGA